MMQRILDLLKSKKPPTSAEIRERLAEIDLPAAQANVEALQAQREKLLLDASENDLEAIEANIRRAQRDGDRQRVAKVELERLLTDAVERERLAEVGRRAAGAWALNAKVLTAYAKLHDAAVEVAEQLAIIQQGEAELRECNAIIVPAGYAKVPWPRGQLLELFEFSDGQLPDPPREWSLRGYWPSVPTYSNGALLTSPLRTDRRFDRARELLNTSPRKAAA